jgi:DNA (cytosine-5)-methyltransferase 1
LISVFASLIVSSRPKAFVFENVEGFLTLSDGRFVFELLDPLISVGYRIHLRKVNAAHFGVPQHRKRIVAIGGLGWDPTFPEVTHSAFGAPGAQRANGFHLLPSPSLVEAFKGMPLPHSSKAGRSDEYAHVYSPFSMTDAERASRLKPGQTMQDLPEEFWHESYKRRANRRVKDGTATERRGGAPAGLRRLVLSEPSKAITGGALRDFVHPTENRPLTIRECARIQTFPDSFVFHGTRSEQIQMIGNAVPVLLAQTIARELLVDLGSKSGTEIGKGMLLSFVPTMSDGMSPVLGRVVDRVNDSFKQRKPEQQSLWA